MCSQLQACDLVSKLATFFVWDKTVGREGLPTPSRCMHKDNAMHLAAASVTQVMEKAHPE